MTNLQSLEQFAARRLPDVQFHVGRVGPDRLLVDDQHARDSAVRRYCAHNLVRLDVPHQHNTKNRSQSQPFVALTVETKQKNASILAYLCSQTKLYLPLQRAPISTLEKATINDVRLHRNALAQQSRHGHTQLPVSFLSLSSRSSGESIRACGTSVANRSLISNRHIDCCGVRRGGKNRHRVSQRTEISDP